MLKSQSAREVLRGMRLWSASIAGGVLLLNGIAAAAIDFSRLQQFDIAPQPLPAALVEFSRQAGVQFTAPGSGLDDVRSAGVKGEYAPESALRVLLRHTGFTFQIVDEGTVAIAAVASTTALEQRRDTPASPTPADDAKDAQKRSFWDRLRLAQADQGAHEGSEPAQGTATSSKSDDRRLEEIVVTAQKREEKLIDVPISIVAIGSEELQQRRVTTIDDLQLAVPGLSIASNGTGQRRIALRGISNVFPAAGTSLIGMYLDEASVTSSPSAQVDLRTYDLERVEVLRGPQGTLYGEGSAGGTVRFITRDPVLDSVEARADITASFTEYGEPGQRIEGVLNMPLVENELGLRLAGTYENGGGWVDQPAIGKKDFNRQKLFNVRLKGLWRPARKFTVNAMALVHRNDAPSSNGEDANGDYTQAFNFTTTPNNEDEYEVYNVTLAYDFSSARLLSTTSYLDQLKTSTNFGGSRQFFPPTVPQQQQLQVYIPLGIFDNEFLTEELRLTSLGTGRWDWTIGAVYRRADRIEPEAQAFFTVAGPTGAPSMPPITLPGSNRSSKSTAVFGDLSFDFTDRLKVGAGLRYFDEDQVYISSVGGMSTRQTGAFDAVTSRLYTQFRLSEEVNTYASVAKGFRSGGFNVFGRPPFDPEDVWTYELGAKLSVADGRLSGEAAVFYSEYMNYQIVGLVLFGASAATTTTNAGDARIRGVEWSAKWHPTDQWFFGLNATYVDSEFVDVDVAAPAYNVGDPLDSFPKYGYTLSAAREFLWSGRTGSIRLDYNEQGRMTFRNRNVFGPTPWYFSESDIINQLNLNMNLQWSERVSLGFFAQNLLNDRGFVSGNSIETQAARARPRTFGFGFGIAFD